MSESIEPTDVAPTQANATPDAGAGGHKHSPLPLTFQTVIPIGYDVVPYLELLDANGVGIAGLGWDDAEGNPLPMNENARLIVTAVNEHAALLARAERAEAENALFTVAIEDLCEGIEEHWPDQSLDHTAMTARVLLAAAAGAERVVGDE